MVVENPDWKMQVSQKTFERLYHQYGGEVSWAKHPPSILTDQFIELVMVRNPHPKIIDLGCGEGNKTFYMIKKYKVQVAGFDVSPLAIEVAQRQAQELNLNGLVGFFCRDITRLTPAEVDQADGVYDYQCINHIPREYHPMIAQLIVDILPSGGVFLTNTFCRETTNFYGQDISQRINGELILQGSEGIAGMYCYFFTREELERLYSPFFQIDSIIKVAHPLIAGRFHWEALMRRK